MSSILKALKRLEEDKAERLDVPVDIGRDILRQPRRRRRSTILPALSLAIGGSLVVVGVVFGLYVWKSVQAPESSTKAESVFVVTPAGTQQSSLAPPDRPVDHREPEVVEVQMAKPPAAIVNEPPAVSATRSVKPPAKAPVATKAPKPAFAPAKSAGSTAAQQKAQPHLVVAGIVFQSDRQARLAIVNDLPVMEGTVIEGAMVDEILADRVRFAWEGRTIEVELGSLE